MRSPALPGVDDRWEHQPSCRHREARPRYTIVSTSTLAAALTSAVALTATVHDTYDSEARSRGARSNNDGLLLFGIRAES